MPEQILKGDARTEQTKDKTLEEPVKSEDEKQKEAQTNYIKSLGKPADKARAALRAAGLPIDHLIPDDVVSFEQKEDGTFVLKLNKELRLKIENTTLVLTTSISGKLSPGKMNDVKGIYGEKKVAFITGRGNIQEMRREGEHFIVNTDNSAAKEIKFKLGDLRKVG